MTTRNLEDEVEAIRRQDANVGALDRQGHTLLAAYDAMKAERDRAVSDLRLARPGSWYEEQIKFLEVERDDLRRQRDRLAEAVWNLSTPCMGPLKRCWCVTDEQFCSGHTKKCRDTQTVITEIEKGTP